MDRVNLRRRILIQSSAISAISAVSTLAGCGGSPNPPPPPPPSSKTYALGWTPASEETYAGISQLSALSFEAVSTQFSGATAASLDLSDAAALALLGWPSLLPAAGDQGGQGSCVAWAVAYAAATSTDVVAGLGDATNPARIGSPADLYAKLMRRESAFTSCGNGTIIKDAMDIMVEEGVLSHAQVPYSDRACVEPSNAGLMFLDGYAKLAVTDRAGIKRALQGFHVLPFGMRVYNDFFDAGQGIYDGPATGTTDAGGHCMVIIGYDDSAGCYKVQNSWGTTWGDGGSVRISYRAFERLANELYSPFQYRAGLANHLYDQQEASGTGRVNGVYGNVNAARVDPSGTYTVTLSFKLNEYLRVGGYNLVLWRSNGAGGYLPTVIADNRSVQSLRGGAFAVSNISPDLVASSLIASINFGAKDRNGVVTQLSLFLTMTTGR